MRKKTSNKKQKSKAFKIFKGFFWSFLAVGFTCLLIGLSVGGFVLNDIISTVNGERLIDLDFYKENQDQTTIVYAYDDAGSAIELVRLHGEENRVWVSSENMSPWIGKAFIAIEDKRFYEHEGVDWYGTVLGVAKSGFKRGASTITQQLIKNLTGENGRTVNRKYNEILTALNLEKHYDKEVILEAYLNTIYLSHGCYGVKTAAETYFGKDIADLNLAECAAIAGITQYPGKFDPLWNPKANKERQEYCLRNMLEQGMINQAQYDEAMAYKLIFTNSPEYVAEEDTEEDEQSKQTEIQSYYVDYVIDTVLRDLKAQGYSHYEANKMLYSGGLRIYTAVDLDIQEIAEDVYVNRVSFPDEVVLDPNEQAQSAITIMDYSGRVVAIVGGAGEKTENRSINRASSAKRPPGSSIKPISIYAPGIEENYIHWSSKIENYGILWKGKRWPVNYDGSQAAGTYTTVRNALAWSLNTVPAQILTQMGFVTSFDYLTNNFHISTLDSTIDAYSPSALATGGTHTGVTTLEMAAAFATFGNGGKYYKPYCYYKVTNSTGDEIILENNTEKYEQVISPETSYIMNQLMRTVVKRETVGDRVVRGTAYGYGVKGFTTFAKTGTTTNYFDRWCVAGTPHYVAAVWFGYDYNKEIDPATNPAAVLFKTVMDRVHEGLEPKEFDDYNAKVSEHRYCTKSGMLATEFCTSTSKGWYKNDFIPSRCTECQAVEEPENPENPDNPDNPENPDNPAPPETPDVPPVDPAQPATVRDDDDDE